MITINSPTLFYWLFNSDINECEKGTAYCKNNEICSNTNGDYNCLCKDGFEKDKENACEGNCNTYNSNYLFYKLLENELQISMSATKMIYIIVSTIPNVRILPEITLASVLTDSEKAPLKIVKVTLEDE